MYICICVGSWRKSDRMWIFNKAVLVEDLKETSIKGQKLLYDYMASKNVTTQ